ncbi:cytochrome P450 [Nocardioides bizhenqiangii]|uniref:Cytochrome P450 n=1 Tax=Nocardioides bizhenqiangii TaxID=3095076 RepID=A0ABZ0ZQX2_9ACTN|nr:MULTISPECIES: cytochrome P450 [unclassified Nocardioides]MDZ5619863.1 cytochrome P450 [Nocardioides sp. HM23]WQQ26131.1 cytochrome P450 [Nocardioides sp. HM61]
MTAELADQSSVDTRPLTMKRFEGSTLIGSPDQPRIPRGALPPGPRWPALAQTIALMRFRHQFHPYLHRKYGEAFTLRLIPGSRPLVLFTSPDVTKEIFAADPAVFHAGKGNAVLGPIMGKNSLLLQDGAEHHRARKLLMPAFLGHALRGYRSMVAEVAAAEIDRWGDGDEFASLDRMNALTLEVILRVVFGVTDEQRLAELRPRVTATVDINPAILLGWAYPWLQRFGPWRRTVDNQVELDRRIYAEIAERRAVTDVADRKDVLSRLMAAGDDSDRLGDTELRDQLVTLLLAGHETTASALSWALYELGRDPELLARSQAAADAGDAEGLAWLEAVLKESMRLHPIIPMVVRTLQKPARVGGLDLPAGTTVGPSILMSHLQDQNFPEPDAFRPERFLPELSGAEAPSLHVWIPFGGGVRRCIGAGFSLMEGTEVLHQVLRGYDISSVEYDVPRVRNITSVPRKGARIRVKRRVRQSGR